MNFKSVFMLILLMVLTSCGRYLRDNAIMPEHGIKQGKSYIFGIFREVSGSEFNDYADMAMIISNTDSKTEYNIFFSREDSLKCIEVTPGNYSAGKFACLARGQVKRTGIFKNFNFNIQADEIIYIGDYEGLSRVESYPVGMIGYIGSLFHTETNDDGYYEVMSSSAGNYNRFSYKWEVQSIKDKNEITKKIFIESYPQFKDYRFISLFETNKS